MSDIARSDQTDALRRSLIARLGNASHDELRVIDVQLVRLERGREDYGELDLSKPRDWQREWAEELIDAEFYTACAILVERDRRVAEIEASTEG